MKQTKQELEERNLLLSVLCTGLLVLFICSALYGATSHTVEVTTITYRECTPESQTPLFQVGNCTLNDTKLI